MSTVKEHKL